MRTKTLNTFKGSIMCPIKYWVNLVLNHVPTTTYKRVHLIKTIYKLSTHKYSHTISLNDLNIKSLYM